MSDPIDPALPNLVVIGAMKCGTTALHRHLDRHPDVAMSQPKELNFFFGGDDARAAPWTQGNWARGLAWYAQHFDYRAAVWGESSPGYTSPDHPESAARMAAVVPHARLVYLVRDPLERALSQYRHHRRDGTERRPPHVALLDPDSHYLARSRYHERLAPFLAHFDPQAILAVAQEELRTEPERALRAVFRLVGVDADRFPDGRGDPFAEGARTVTYPGGRGDRFVDDAIPVADRCADALRDAARSGSELRQQFLAAVRDDAHRLFDLVGHTFPGWSL